MHIVYYARNQHLGNVCQHVHAIYKCLRISVRLENVT